MTHKIIHSLIITIGCYSCGGGDEPQLPKSVVLAKTENSEKTEKVDPDLSVNLDKLSGTELTELSEVLQKRNASEKKEIETLKKLNPRLCRRLSKLRESCRIAVPLITDEASSKLECGNDATMNKNKLEVSIEADGKFEIIADNLLKSASFGRGTSELKFAPIVGGGVSSNPKIVDVRRLILKRTDGKIREPGFNFSFKVNGSEVLGSGDLTQLDEESLQIKLVKFSDLSDACHVPSSEIQAIRKEAGAAEKSETTTEQKPATAKDTGAEK
jgi:hypothetical protein